MARKNADGYGRRDIMRAFQNFAPGNGSSGIDPKAVAEAMVKWANVPEQEALKLVAQLETSSNGKWDFKKYISVMAPE